MNLKNLILEFLVFVEYILKGLGVTIFFFGLALGALAIFILPILIGLLFFDHQGQGICMILLFPWIFVLAFIQKYRNKRGKK